MVSPAPARAEPIAGHLHASSDLALPVRGQIAWLRAHLNAQRGERSRRVGADRPRLTAEQFGDLGVAAVLVIAEHEYRSLAPRQLADLGEQSTALGVLVRVIGGAFPGRGRVARWDQPPGPPAPGQELVQHHLPHVELGPVQAADRVPPGVGPDQYLLGYVLRGG